MNHALKYTIIRSDRKSVAVEIKPDGQIVVRAPKRMKIQDIQAFVRSREAWIRKHLEEVQSDQEKMKTIRKLSMEEIRALADQALKVIPERVKYYAPLVGVTYGNITIRNQRTRWGSCSSRGNLNFNCLLMLAPPEVLDSVVVHELCHRKEMNHSKKFYAEVYRVYPEYDRCHKWLKEHGRELMGRMQI